MAQSKESSDTLRSDRPLRDPTDQTTRPPSRHRPSRYQRTDWPWPRPYHRPQVPTPRPSVEPVSRKTDNSPGVQRVSPRRHRPQSKPIRSRSPFGYMTQLTSGGKFDASPSQSSPTERTRPVACNPWRKLLVYSVCGTLLARLGRDCSRGSTTMFSSFADLAFPKQNCSLAKSHCVPGIGAKPRPIRLRPLGVGSLDMTGRLFAAKKGCFVST